MKGLAITLTLLSLAVLSGCGQKDSAQVQTPHQTQPRPRVINSHLKISGLSESQSYALRGVDQSWPGTGDNNLVLAANKQTSNYFVIFDGSGSMNSKACGDGNKRITVAKRAIRSFFDALPKDSNVGLIIFDSRGARQVQALQPNNPTRLKQITDNAVAGGGTPLGRSLDFASHKLQLQGQKQQGYGQYNIVVLTDGVANDENMMTKTVNDIVTHTPINIHTIGFCLGSHHALNRKGVINYQPAANSAELVKGLNSVLAESPSFTSDSFSSVNN